MKFAGLIKSSFIDYPGHIAAIIFTYGCNFNCWYCHNMQLIPKDGNSVNKIDESEILKFLEDRKGKLEGLVITGGEPTLHSELETFIMKVKKLGYKVKLDTNGTNPQMLEQLLQNNLLDFIAMDIKTSLENYEELVGGSEKIDTKNIKRSIEIIMNSGIDYEFRTTMTPDVYVDDIIEITKLIKNAKSYAIQKYVPNNAKVIKLPHKYPIFELALEEAKKNVENCFLRGF